MSKLETGLHYPLKLDALPPNWQVGYVGDFADEIQPGFASGKHNKEGAGIPHIRPYNIDRQGKLDLSEIKSVAPDSDAKRLKTDDVLFNNTNSPELIGKTAVIASAGDWGFSNHMTRIRFKDDVAPKFAAYQLHFLWMTGYYLHNCVKHVNQASIASKTLADAVPFIAPPLDQQKRIVAEIEKQFSLLDEAVTNLKRVKANLKRYKAAVLKAAVEGRLVETEAEIARREGRSYEPADSLIARTEVPPRPNRYATRSKGVTPGHAALAVGNPGLDLPSGWAWTALVEVARMESGHTPSREHPEWWDGDIPWIGIADAREHHGRIINETAQHTNNEGLANSAARLLPTGTVCVSRTASVGYVVVTGRPMATSQDFVNWVPTQAVSSDWLRIVFLADRVALIRFGKGSVHKTIYFPEWLSVHIGMPPRAEQDRIVAEVERRLSLVHETEIQVDFNLQRAERLRQSTLASAFFGNLLFGGANKEARFGASNIGQGIG